LTVSDGWPFLIAPGRQRDYSLVLAPEFLVAASSHGVLEAIVRPGDERDPARVLDIDDKAGRPLTVVYRTHLVTAQDVGAHTDPRDASSRRLRFMYGFVCPTMWVPAPAAADLAATLVVALTRYREFLADETAAGVVAAPSFPLSSVTTSARPPRPMPTPAAPTATDLRTPAPAGARRWVMLTGVAVVVAIAAVLIGQLRSSPQPVCNDSNVTVTSTPSTLPASQSPSPGATGAGRTNSESCDRSTPSILRPPR
jgi:hypothetical protein